MSRRKQAQPRSLKYEDMDKKDVVGEYEADDRSVSPCDDNDEDIKSEHSYDSLESGILPAYEGAVLFLASYGSKELQDAIKRGKENVLTDPIPGSIETVHEGNSSRLEHLIEKIQANKENHEVTSEDIKDVLGSTPGSSWSSAAEGATPSPTSTPGPDAPEPPFTLGATDHTPYQCHFCDKAFPRLSYLKKHEQTHSDQMPFRCEWCSRLFKHKRSRDRHVKLHTGDRKYRCAHCDSAFSRSDHLKIHMKTHDNQKPFQCTACNRGYNTAAALTSHMQGHKRGRAARRPPRAAAAVNVPATLACGYCTRDGFPDIEQLRAHVQTEHVQSAHERTAQGVEHTSPAPPEQLTPTDLSKKGSRDDSDAPSRSADDTSSPLSTTTQTLLCNQCNAALPDFESFRAHVKAHLEAGERDVCASDTCPHCSATFTSAVMCARHVCAHFAAATAEFACSPCQRAFAAPDELQRHLLELHTQHIYRCALCSEIFDSKVAIQVHFAVQHCSESTMYRCTACGGSATFRSEAEFARHVRARHWPSAATATPRRCPLCRAACATDTELRMHVAAHARAHHAAAVHATHAAHVAHAAQATHAYRCPVCRDAFAVEFLLDRHMQTHHAAVASQLINGDNCRQKSVRHENNNGIVEDETACEPCVAGDEPRARARHKNGAVSLRCAYCGEQSRSRADLEAHTKTHSAGVAPGRHKCLICDEVLPTAAVLAEHKLTHCKVVAGDVCARCHQTLTSEEHFMAHLAHHAPALPAPCVVCRQTLASDVEARLHARFHLKGTSASAALDERTCALCLQIFVPARAEARGVSEAGDPARVCAACYLRHAGTAPVTPPEMPQISAQSTCSVKVEANASDECRLCRRSLGSPARLQTHLIEHTFAGCGAFTCYLCSAVFTGAAGLQRHLPEHGAAARPYDCARCGLKFFFRAELDNHAFVHADEAEEEARRRALYGAGEGDRRTYTYPQTDFEGTLELLAARVRLETGEGAQPTKRQRTLSPLLSPAVKVKRESEAEGGAEEYIEVTSPPVMVKSETDAELQ